MVVTNSFIKLGVLVAACLLNQAVLDAQNGASGLVTLDKANLGRIGWLQTESGQRAGTCFYCDERGYVTTCFSNISDCKDVYVVFDAKTRLRVGGFVAASRGLDIAVLQLLDIPKEDVRFRQALELRGDYVPKLEDRLLAWPSAEGMTYSAENFPSLWRILRGDEYCLGINRLDGSPIGCRPDTCWFWLSNPCPLTSHGAPVFNSIGHVVGMMSLGPFRQRQVYSALHIQHVLDVIPKDDVKPKPIKLLKTWVDPLPSGPDQSSRISQLLNQFDSPMGIDLDYGAPLAERYSMLLSRLNLATSEKGSIEQNTSNQQEHQLDLLAKVDALRTQITSIVPEERYTEKERVTRSSSSSRDRDRDREETITVTRYRHSARQLEQLKPLNLQIESLLKQADANTLRFQFDTRVRLPFVNKIIDRLSEDLFYRADPLFLRPADEHVEFETALSKLVDEGGAQASVYIARAMSRIHLRRFNEAVADLKEAYDIDTKVRPLCRLLNARVVGLRDSPEKMQSTFKGLLRDNKDDPKFLTVAARIEMDSKSAGAAARQLQQVHELLPDELEVQTGLAWLLSASNTNSKLALECATNVVTRTGYRDWSSLAALANVHMMYRKPDLAAEAIEAAVNAAPDSAEKLCRDWQSQIKSEHGIKRDWK